MAGVIGVWQVPKQRGTAPSVKGVPAAERALAVLTAFRQGDGALSLAELAERTGLVKSTIMRLAVSLQHFQLLARLPDGKYQLGAEILRLGTAYQQAFSLQDHVLPTLERLAAHWRPYVATCIDLFGADRCLFESNFPVEKMGIGYGALWNAFKRIAAGASAEEKRALFAGTAARVYRL